MTVRAILMLCRQDLDLSPPLVEMRFAREITNDDSRCCCKEINTHATQPIGRPTTRLSSSVDLTFSASQLEAVPTVTRQFHHPILADTTCHNRIPALFPLPSPHPSPTAKTNKWAIRDFAKPEMRHFPIPPFVNALTFPPLLPPTSASPQQAFQLLPLPLPSPPDPLFPLP